MLAEAKRLLVGMGDAREGKALKARIALCEAGKTLGQSKRYDDLQPGELAGMLKMMVEHNVSFPPDVRLKLLDDFSQDLLAAAFKATSSEQCAAKVNDFCMANTVLKMQDVDDFDPFKPNFNTMVVEMMAKQDYAKRDVLKEDDAQSADWEAGQVGKTG